MENKKLLLLVNKIYNNTDITSIYNEHIKEMQEISPDEVFNAMSALLRQGKTAQEVLPLVDKVINVLYKKLSAYKWVTPGEGTFIYYLIQENNGLRAILEGFKPLIKRQDISDIKKEAGKLVQSLKEYNVHLLKLENILFPALEKKHEMFGGLSIMWALHDEARDLLKQAEAILIDTETPISDINKIIGKLYFKYFGLIQKQELLLFPSAIKWLSEKELNSMHAESFDFGFVFIDEPEKPSALQDAKEHITADKFETQTGSLNFHQLTAVLNNLPFDITVIDKDDRVIYFSDNNDRIFPRTASVIGRKVQNCHPPKSLAMVEEILTSFKENRKDTETFWINMSGKTILIKYSALRDGDSRYLGTLEVTQDITDIKKLEGEKRLIDGND